MDPDPPDTAADDDEQPVGFCEECGANLYEGERYGSRLELCLVCYALLTVNQ